MTNLKQFILLLSILSGLPKCGSRMMEINPKINVLCTNINHALLCSERETLIEYLHCSKTYLENLKLEIDQIAQSSNITQTQKTQITDIVHSFSQCDIAKSHLTTKNNGQVETFDQSKQCNNMNFNKIKLILNCP